MMDSPLAPAEFSRLRKAIQQRERQLAQGLSTTGADLNISRALSNLSLYLPSQTQLAAVLKDWERSDSTQRLQIIIWLQQNLLNSPPSQDAMVRPPELPPRSGFIAPPPPPPLPTRASTISTQPSWRPSSGQSTPPTPSRPQPTGTNTTTHTRMNSTPATPSRELYTQASLRPPTPPPKDNVTPRNLGGLGRSYSLRIPQASYPSSFPQVDSPTNGTSSNPSTSPTHHTRSSFSGRNSVGAGTRSGASFTGRSDSVGSSQQPWTQATQSASSNQPASNTFVASSQPSPAPLPNQFDTTQFVSQIQEMSRVHQQNILAQISSAQGSGSPTTAPFGQVNSSQQWMETIAKIQAQQNANVMQQLAQAQAQQTSNSAQTLAAAQQSQQAQTSQILAAAQQSQQAQTNQMLSMLQQYQQNTPAFDPSQYLAQSQQQNQQVMNILSQMQANAGVSPGGVDWASLASGSGMDATTLISMVASGTDPTTLAMQGVGFMFGM